MTQEFSNQALFQATARNRHDADSIGSQSNWWLMSLCGVVRWGYNEDDVGLAVQESHIPREAPWLDRTGLTFGGIHWVGPPQFAQRVINGSL